MYKLFRIHHLRSRWVYKASLKILVIGVSRGLEGLGKILGELVPWNADDAIAK